MEKAILTRTELYNLVRSEPLSCIAKKHNLSDHGIRRKCKKLNIPIPENGQLVQFEDSSNIDMNTILVVIYSTIHF